MLRPYVLAMGILLSGTAFAAEYYPLHGRYAITPKNYLDPAPDEPKDSHLRIELAGKAARDLYNAMTAKERIDDCTGAKMKTVGEMRCYLYENPKRYRCDFAIDIASQKIEYGFAC